MHSPSQTPKLLQRNSNHTIIGYLVILLIVSLIVLPLLWILGYSILSSLRDPSGGVSEWTIRYWISIVKGGTVRSSMLFSLAVSGTVTAIVLTTTLSLITLSSSLRRNRLFLIALCITLGTPSTVVALLVSQILGAGGFISRVCYVAGVIDSPTAFPTLVNDRLGIGMIAALSFTLLPLPLLYFSQLWQTLQLDRMLIMAESLGASSIRSRLSIALPMLLQRGYSITFLVFLLCLGSYEIPYLLGRQSPEMISVATQRRTGLFDLSSRPEAFVLATLYFLTCFLLLFLYIRGRAKHA